MNSDQEPEENVTPTTSVPKPSLCVFCLSEGDEPEERGTHQIRDRKHDGVKQREFFQMVQTYLETKAVGASGNTTRTRVLPSLPVAITELNVGSCLECFRTLDSFCGVYRKIKSLEKTLDAKLDKLKSSMKAADEDPSRIMAFKEWCLSERRNARKSLEFRRKFQNQCEIISTNDEANQPRAVELESRRTTVTIKKEPEDISSSQPVASPFSDVPESPLGPSSEPEDASLPSITDLPHKRKKSIQASPSRSDHDVSCDSPVAKRKRKRSQTFKCETCAAVFQSFSLLDKHVYDCHVAVEEDIGGENCNGIIKTEPDDNNDTAGVETDWLAEVGNPSGSGDNDGDNDKGDGTDDDWIADDHGSPSSSDGDSGGNSGDDAEESDWHSEGEDDWEPKRKSKDGKEGKQKRAAPVSVPVPKPKRIGIRNRLGISNVKCPFECRLCRKDPQPRFGSVSALQVHQKYLHTNGYTMLTKTENLELLRLGEKNLKLKGVEVVVKNCDFPSCPKEFLLQQELDHHKNYHETVTCETCNVVMSNCVDMVYHEIKHYKDGGQHYAERLVLSCGKCIYSTAQEGELVNHYLEHHMSKPPLSASCPICHMEFKYMEKVPVIHYINYHDLTRLENQSSNGIPCPQESCSAYFLTEDQIQQHWNSVHGKQSDALFDAALSAVEKRSQKVTLKSKQKAIRHQTRKFSQECEYCSKKFRAEYELREHIWRCHADLKFGGPCGNIRLTGGGLTIDEFATNNNCLCNVCERVFSHEEQLERHKLHHGEFKCNFCDVTKSLATEIPVHETVHSVGGKDGTFNCPRCSFTTTKRPDYIDHHLETHMNVPSDRKRCPICRKPVPTVVKKNAGKSGQKHWIVAHYMDNHDKSGLDPAKMPTCTQCQGYFRTAVQLHNHTREIHGRQSLHECYDCGMIFEKRDKLKRHRVSKHKVDESTFQFACSFPECGRRFERKIEMDYHESNAHNEKDMGMQICSECGKQCAGTGQLKSHMKVHRNKEKRPPRKRIIVPEPCMCDLCGKHFGDKLHMQAHRRRHRGPDHWNFVCEVCSRRCPTRYKLANHMRVHTKEKPFICQVCGSAYMNAQNLRAHARVKHPDVKME